MSPRLFAATALSLAVLALPAIAQTGSIPVELPTVYAPPDVSQAATQVTASTLPPAQLDQLVAPIALYPDPVLTNILAASTYPAQIAEAQRFSAANEGLQGAALTNAAAAHHWDPSVQSLLQYPQVLQQLDANLEWTDRLGQAFIAQQADVLNAVQRLRLRAQAAGTLTSTPQADVVNEGGDVAILPPSDQQVFVPSYNDACVYASAGCGGDPIAWGDGLWLPYGYVPWGVLDWGHRRIEYNGEHRGGMRQNHLAGGDGAEGVWHHAGAPIGRFGRSAAEIGSLDHFGRDPARIGGLNHFPSDPAQLGSVTRGQTDEDRFNYAPPAGQRFDEGGSGGGFATRPIMPRPIMSTGVGHGVPAGIGHGLVTGGHGPAAFAHAAPPAAAAHFGGGGRR